MDQENAVPPVKKVEEDRAGKMPLGGGTDHDAEVEEAHSG
jgi:hypothetical protein